MKILCPQEKFCIASPLVSPVPFETPFLYTGELPKPAIYTEFFAHAPCQPVTIMKAVSTFLQGRTFLGDYFTPLEG